MTIKTWKNRFICSMLVSLATAPGLAWAQNGAAIAPIHNWSYQQHSSTATEGFLRGRASVIESAGQMNYLNSVAAVNFQEAIRRRIENHNLYVRKYFENQELNRQYREKYAPIRPTEEQWKRIAESALPARLKLEELDPATGRIVWPHILRGEEYRALREPIEEVFATRTPDNSGDGSPSQRELAPLIDGITMLLKSNSHTVSSSQFAAAIWFLRSLAYEARLPLESQVVAQGGSLN
jgi:hypothetical protein